MKIISGESLTTLAERHLPKHKKDTTYGDWYDGYSKGRGTSNSKNSGRGFWYLSCSVCRSKNRKQKCKLCSGCLVPFGVYIGNPHVYGVAK